MPNPKSRIVIDTNIFISFLLTKASSNFDKLFNEGEFTLLYSQELIDEFILVAKRKKFAKYFSEDDLQSLLLMIKNRAVFIDVFSETTLCHDPKDNFLLSLAKDGKANFIVTGDKDLLTLKKFGKTKILTIAEFMKL